jgi:hypothetical protein
MLRVSERIFIFFLYIDVHRFQTYHALEVGQQRLDRCMLAPHGYLDQRKMDVLHIQRLTPSP